MKLRVLFLRKKHIYYFILTLVVFMLFIFSRISDTNYISTMFSLNSNDKAIKADLTGDGKEDLLYITKNKDKYSLQVNTEKESLYLDPHTTLDTLGDYSSSWPMRLKLLDISRDKIPEIFVQSSQNNNPIQHIFLYNKKDKFEDIFCSSNNIIGFLDCTNNKTPKIVSGTLKQNNFILSNYILIQNKLEKYHYVYSDTFMGKDTILHLINNINNASQNYVQSSAEIFDPVIPSSSLSILSSLPYMGNNFIFQDALFTDIKSNNNGDPTHIQWTLNFRGTSIKSNESKNFTLKVNLRTFDNSKDSFYFKIYSIALENK